VPSTGLTSSIVVVGALARLITRAKANRTDINSINVNTHFILFEIILVISPSLFK
jgi:hypothetical protein